MGCADNPVTPAANQPRLEVRQGAPSVIVLTDDPDGVIAAHGIKPSHVYRYAIKGFSASVSDVAKAGLMKDARVRKVEDDGISSITQVGSWGQDRIDQRNLPLDLSYSPPNNGQGVRAYIVDSGIRYTHTEFGGRASNGIDLTGGDGSDCIGHGTHVAGTVGGFRYGIANQVTLVSVRVFGCTGSAENSVILAAMDWVAKNAVLPAVVNMSLSGSATQAVDEAVTNLTARGISVAVAAGNDDFDACNLSPARAPSAMTVGATGGDDARASFSNWGDCVDIFAPGSSIPSAYHGDDVSQVGKSGTSMASPHVAGVAALILSANPSWTAAQVDSAISARSSKGKVIDAKSNRFHLLYSGLDDDLSTPEPPPPPDPIVPPTDFSLQILDYPKGNGKRALLRATWKDGNPTNDGGVVIRYENGQRVQYDPLETLDFVVTQGDYNFYIRSFGYDSLGRVVYGQWSGPFPLRACERNCTGSANR
jgi:serine protease